MKTEKGKMYVTTHTKTEMVILCTADKPEDSTKMTGFVIKQEDKFSDFKVGDFSETWNVDVFKEYDKDLVLNNNNWVPYKEIGTCQA